MHLVHIEFNGRTVFHIYDQTLCCLGTKARIKYIKGFKEMINKIITNKKKIEKRYLKPTKSL